MKPRIRPLSNLYHRWGRRLGVSAERVAKALVIYGVIERVGDHSYRETRLPSKGRMTKAAYDALVIDYIRQYVENMEVFRG